MSDEFGHSVGVSSMGSRPLNLHAGGRISVPPDVELIELLGSGAFGSVWKVANCRTGELYALKILQGLEPGSTLATRFRLEAQVSIPSEHIVPVLKFLEWDSRTYLILFEYFPARSLERYMAEEEPDDAQKRRIFQEILTGVGDAHRCNIIHRDLKPANILVGHNGRIKVIDFGLAKFQGWGLTADRQLMGTLPWIAPEILLGGARVADARVDIYALGQILYELATGEHFWVRSKWGLDGVEGFLKYLQGLPPPTEAIDLSTYGGDFFEGAKDILPRMVKIDPAERYATIEEILIDLGSSPTVAPIPKDSHLRFPMLVLESGSNKGARTLLNIADGERCVLGRQNLAANNDSISRQHLEFTHVGGNYKVRDLGSKNGTLLGGNLLSPQGPPVAIQHGDRIRVGDVFLRFVFLRE